MADTPSDEKLVIAEAAASAEAADGADGVEAAGHFRIYLGAAAGVGKTYSMLSEGHRRSQRGTDVAIGFVEAHRRLHTEELVAGLEVVPRKTVEYRGTLLSRSSGRERAIGLSSAFTGQKIATVLPSPADLVARH